MTRWFHSHGMENGPPWKSSYDRERDAIFGCVLYFQTEPTTESTVHQRIPFRVDIIPVVLNGAVLRVVMPGGRVEMPVEPPEMTVTGFGGFVIKTKQGVSSGDIPLARHR